MSSVLLTAEQLAVDETDLFLSSLGGNGKRQRKDARALVPYTSRGGGGNTNTAAATISDDDDDDASEAQQFFSRFGSAGSDDDDDIDEIVSNNRRAGASAAPASFISMSFMPAADSNEARPADAPGAAPDHRCPTETTSPDYDDILEQLGEPDPPDGCWGCTHARSDTTAVAYQVCLRMEDMYRNRAANTHPVQLARDLEAYFEENIRAKQNRRIALDHRRSGFRSPMREECRRWRAATIHAHCTDHRVDSATEILTLVREIKTAKKKHVCFNLYRQRMDPVTGVIVKYPTLEGTKILKELNLQLIGALKLKPQSLLFSSSSSPAIQTASAAMVDASKKRVYGDMSNQFV